MSNDKLAQAIRRLRRGGAGYVLGDVACSDLLHWLEAYAAEKQAGPVACISAKAPTPASASDQWRKLAQQFDGQRMAAMGHLRTLLDNPQAHADAARQFLAATPAEQIASVTASPAVAHGWQPIETAPKDGTVIALRRDKYVYSGRWGNGTYNTGWLAHGSYMVFAFSPLNPPTHWMPLESDVPVQENDRG